MSIFPIANPRNSITAKLLTIVFSIYLIITVTLTVTHMLADYYDTKDTIIQDMKASKSTFELGLSGAIWYSNKEQLESLTQGILRIPFIVGVSVSSDILGKVSAGIVVNDNNEIITAAQGEAHTSPAFSASELFHYTDSLVYNDRIEGKVHVGKITLHSNRGVVWQRIQYSFMFIIINAVLKTAALWIIFLWVGRVILSQPLSLLTKATQQLNLDNLENLHLDIKTKGNNELKILQDAFIGMIQKLLHARQEINAYADQLKEREEQYRTLVDNVNVGIYRNKGGPKGEFVQVNPAIVAMFEYESTEQFMEQNALDLYTHSDKRQHFLNMIQQQGECRNFELHLRKKDNTPFWVSCSAKAHYDEHGDIQWIDGILEDITERKNAEELSNKYKEELEKRVKERTRDLDAAKQEAEKANAAKSEFLANMSHELRTPLNAILGFSQMMVHNSNLTSDQKENIQIINRSGEYLLTLINDILDMSKIEAGRVTLNTSDFSLYRMLNDTKDMFRIRAEDKGLEMQFEIEPDVPECICTDEAKLRQVLINLLSNAVKFTSKGCIFLRVGMGQVAPGSQSLVAIHFQIKDTGPGIAHEHLEHIFDAFTQTHSLHEPNEGTGLGLSISRKFVQLMGGDIHVESRVESQDLEKIDSQGDGDHGTLFYFDIYVKPGDTSKVQTEALQHRQITGVESDTEYRILVVDDVLSNRQILAQNLTSISLEVRQADSGKQAVSIWKEWHPHLIWMDIRMPGMDGYEATRHIKSSEQGKETIVIAISASAFEDKREEALAAGCDDFIAKPFKEAEIFEKVSKYLGVRYIYNDMIAMDGVSSEKSNEKENLYIEIQNLPSEWKMGMKQAIGHLNPRQMNGLIEQVREQDEALANAIKKKIDQFEYEQILRLL
ncbi:MAG: response regulator [SAR324 cluster bacterium]|nr:response regulator [SAR324 cluster bacterium]